jgi:hypothetical protein
MLRRPVLIAMLGILAGALHAPPAWTQESAAQERSEALALSRRIDDYLARRAREAKVAPAALAEDAVYFRRLNLDLVGKIPTLLDARDFLQNPDPDKRWQWTEQLLASKAYTQHMANVWRTVILGNVANEQARSLTPAFEAWLRDQLQKNAGLDALTRDLLTATVNARNPFANVNGMRQNSPAAFFIGAENKAENLAAATARVFLGIKLDCAQCHAHPFASWTREQFWEFAAFYSGQAPLNQVLSLPRLSGGREILIPNTSKVVKAKFLTGQEPKWERTSDSRTVLVDWLTASDNPYFARAMADHVWTYLMGASLLEPIQEPGTEGRISHPELLDELALELAAHRFDLKFLLRAIVHSAAYQRSGAGKGSEEEVQLFARRVVRGLAPEQIYDSIAEATDCYKADEGTANNRGAPELNQQGTARGAFLAKFVTQDHREEPQTSILQALFLMNGKFLSERNKVESNAALRTLTTQPTSLERRVETLYLLVLSRPPRPEEAERMSRYIERGASSEEQARALGDVYWALLNSAEFLLNH